MASKITDVALCHCMKPTCCCNNKAVASWWSHEFCACSEMPRRKSVQTLENLCVEAIGNHLDKFNARPGRPASPLFGALGDSRIEGVLEGTDGELNCFECLPSRFLVSITNVAKKNGSFKDHLVLLITPHLQTLDLTGLNDADKLTGLRTAALKRSPLKHLIIPFHDIPSLENILPAFPNLTKLDTSYSSDGGINDDFLARLATCCLNLQELNVQGCCNVTDLGIQHLVGFRQDGRDGAVPGCKSLLRLNVLGTRVTPTGARLALEHLPKLEVFGYRWSLQIAAEMHRTNGTTRPLNLVNLNAAEAWVGDDDAPLSRRSTLIGALRLCPFVVDVNMSVVPFLLDENFRLLLDLKCLKKLTIDRCQEISFNGGLLPILKKFGPSSLESLTLWGIRDVNIGSVVEFCSALQLIHLDSIQSYSPCRPGLRPDPQHLPHLQHITIREYTLSHSMNRQISCADLSLLLGSARALTHLRLFDVSNFTDRIVKEAIAQHGFPCLADFALYCHRSEITKKVVDLLVELDNPLSSIAIKEEPPIRLRLCGRYRGPPLYYNVYGDLWKKKILENNWELKVHYLNQ